MGCGTPRAANELYDVERLRRDDTGALWVRARTAGLLRRVPGASWERQAAGWPVGNTTVGGRRVVVTDAGIDVDGRTFARSNDAWGLGRRPLTAIVDVATDHRRGILWLARRDGGLFKVLVGRLPN